jgi:hypothetical protein
MLVAVCAACGMSVHGGRVLEPWTSDPEPPVETVPMTGRFSAYRSMSIHLVAAEGLPRGTLGRLYEKLHAKARERNPGLEILPEAATGTLDLRVTVQQLEPEGRKDGDHTPCKAVVLFELFEVEQARLLSSFTVTAERNDHLFDKPFDPVYSDVTDQLGAWLIYRSKNR